MTEPLSCPAFRHSIHIQIRFSDIDLQGHVSNTVYQTYFDFGKLNYFDLVLGDIDWNKQAIVGASVKIDYIKPVFLKTKIAVKTRVSHIGNKSMTVEHYIINSDNNETMATCTTVLVCFDHETQQSIPVPEEWRRNIINYEGNQD
ncbi:MAG: acyl-CoA thioesterase [Bacteroidales bacterium]|jgi:acyl-CoA thioester hydrolase|nr:acyl-CoA thioesterase [Bacteroidales bacterium]